MDPTPANYPLQVINQCVHTTQTLVQQWRDKVTNTPSAYWELELRFGQITDSGFVPGTSFQFFNNALRWFETCRSWSSVDDWRTFHEFYYRVNRRTLRTTTTLDSALPSGVDVCHVMKQKHTKHNFHCDFDSVPASHRDASWWPDIRVELASETPVTTELPDVTNTQLVRIKQRKSFHYRLPADSSASLWRYDFTRCWSGQTMAEAEQNQRSMSTEAPRYEIEIECSNPEALCHTDPNYVSRSLLLKANDFYTPSVWDVLNVHRSLRVVDYCLCVT